MPTIAQQLRAGFGPADVDALYREFGERLTREAVLTLRDCAEHDGWPCEITLAAIADETAMLHEAERQALARRGG